MTWPPKRKKERRLESEMGGYGKEEKEFGERNEGESRMDDNICLCLPIAASLLLYAAQVFISTEKTMIENQPLPKFSVSVCLELK